MSEVHGDRSREPRASNSRVLIARGDELRRLAAALEDARAGHGRMVIVSGEPGIGKTRLCDELSRIAEHHGVPMVWGRCWEAGGAPPFWPWVEIIRSLVDRSIVDPAEIERAGARRAEVAAALADVGRIVPSVARRLSQPPSAPELDPQQARFRLFESISTVLSCAAEKSLVVVVDDAHVADESSLRVLQFVARSMRSWPMLLVVTLRDAATKTAPDAAALLHEIAREGEGITLARLSLSEVEEWLSGQGLDLAGGTASAVFRTTEGNPLFVDETVRFLRSRPREGPLLVPDQVRAAINSHLRLLSDDARAVLTVGSALGRSIDARFLAEVLGRDAEAIEAALREARAVRVVEDHELPDHYVFAHILIREELYRELGVRRRAETHWAIGELLARRGDEEAAQAAHHLALGLVAAGPNQPAVGSVAVLVEVTSRAASRAMKLLAFEEASAAFERALALVPSAGREACELLIGLGEARIRAGVMQAGQEVCVRAAEIARALPEPQLLARAALVYGTELLGGRVDPQMVALLRDALAALGDDAPHLRARMLARLGSALVPSTPDKHIEAEGLAREALELARRLGDAPTLYAVLQWSLPAMGFTVPSDDRASLAKELLQHALSLGDSVGAVRARQLSMLLAIERGDPELSTMMEAFTRQIEALRRPHYLWRLPMMRSLLAVLDGRFDDAQREAAELLRIGTEGNVLFARAIYGLLRTSTMHALGDPSAYPEDWPLILDSLQWTPFQGHFRAWCLALWGKHDEARAVVRDSSPHIHSLPLLSPAADTACILGDEDAARVIYDLLAPEEDRNPQGWGPSGAMGLSPTSVLLGRLALLLSRLDAAVVHLDKGIARCERSRMRPHLAWAERHLAETLLRRDGPGDRVRAAALATRARDAATTMKMTALVRSIDALPLPAVGAPESKRTEGATFASARPAAPAASAADVTLTREGDVWLLSSGSVSVRLRDGKGVRYLDVLLRHPQQELHVSQLLGLDDGDDEVVASLRGDAGPMLDAAAKSKYRARLEDLRDAFEEATRFGDRTRAERVQGEIDAIADELARGVGLGGRDRKAASVVERARINVQRRLRDTLERVEAHAPALGKWLAASVRTGTYCSFSPVGPPPTR